MILPDKVLVNQLRGVEMKNWIAKYNLEVLTFISGTFIVCLAAFYPSMSIIQRFIIGFLWLFTLHEWEEGRYPGGFVDLIASKILKMEVSQQTADLSRIPTMILIFGFTIVPFFLDSVWWIVLLPVYLSLFEGFVHVAGIKLFRLERPYTPGMVTALAELVLGAICLAYMIMNCGVMWWEYLVAVVLYFGCFAFMQSRLTKLVGIRYRVFPKIIRSRIKELRQG